MSTASLLDELQAQLSAFCRSHSGDPLARVSDVEVMPGHAGFTYGFRLRAHAAGTALEEAFVLRLPPPGVRYEGTADVLRHARLLEALSGGETPVPPVRWSGEDERWFGRPYFIMERLPGATLLVPENGSVPYDAAALARMTPQAIRSLVALHRIDWQQLLPDWGPPRDLVEDVVRWDRFRERCPDPELVRLAPEIRARLLARLPQTPRMGIFHGDFQWSNLLYEGERLSAVLDWELAGIGAVLNDLGWIMVFSDRESWAHEGAGRLPVPAPEQLLEVYREAWGGDPGDVAWYRALAGYKFAIIAGFNLMLHRRGKRVDPHYEVLAPSIPRLLERAGEVLSVSRPA